MPLSPVPEPFLADVEARTAWVRRVRDAAVPTLGAQIVGYGLVPVPRPTAQGIDAGRRVWAVVTESGEALFLSPLMVERTHEVRCWAGGTHLIGLSSIERLPTARTARLTFLDRFEVGTVLTPATGRDADGAPVLGMSLYADSEGAFVLVTDRPVPGWPR